MTMEDSDLAELILKLRHEVIWKPKAAARHLLKRKLRGHLSADATLADYEVTIRQLLETIDASLYVYYTDATSYISIAAWLDGRLWLVIATMEGVLETAFVVDNPDTYLEREAFQYVAKLGEVIK